MEDVITDSVAAPDLLDRSEWLPESFKQQQAQTGLPKTFMTLTSSVPYIVVAHTWAYVPHTSIAVGMCFMGHGTEMSSVKHCFSELLCPNVLHYWSSVKSALSNQLSELCYWE